VVALNVEPADGPSESIELDDPYVVICGFTGRDRDEVDAHIEELREIGVEPPASVPAFFPVPGSLLRQPNGSADSAEVASRTTTGEAEPVLIRIPGREDLLAVGSDHTDRGLETVSIAAGKEACPKPMSRSAWLFDDVRERWDSLGLSARHNGSPNRSLDGTLAGLTHPDDLIALLEQSLPLPQDRPLVLFLGTLAGGHPAPELGRVHNFTAELWDPETRRSLVCSYDIREPAEEAAG
jgi:hypothetical protein